MGMFIGGKMQPSRRGMLGMVAGGGALLFTTGLIGVSAAAAATNKPVPGVGIKCCKRPNGQRARIVPIPTNPAGGFVYTATEAGDYDVEVDRADLQRAINALAAQEMVEAVSVAANQRRVPGAAVVPPADPATRIAIVRFAPGLRVTAPNGQVAVAGNPGVFILSAGPQVFIVNGMAAGGVISASIETVDVSDLVPAAQIAAAGAGTTARGASADDNRDVILGRVLGANAGYRGRMVPNARAGMRLSRRR